VQQDPTFCLTSSIVDPTSREWLCCRDSILYRLVLAYFTAHDHWASQHNITIMYPGHCPTLVRCIPALALSSHSCASSHFIAHLRILSHLHILAHLHIPSRIFAFHRTSSRSITHLRVPVHLRVPSCCKESSFCGHEKAIFTRAVIWAFALWSCMTLPCIARQRHTLSRAYAFSRVPALYRLSTRRTDPCPSTPLVCHTTCCTSVTRTAALLHVITYYRACSPYPFRVRWDLS